MSRVKKSYVEDWTALPFVIITSIGFIVAIMDFIFIQKLKFQLLALIGLVLAIVGGYLRIKSRLNLKKKAGFDNLAATSRLQIVEDQKLVTDGLYGVIRNPLYLGETLRNLGIVLVFSSWYGVLFILVGTLLLLFRIGVEEEMLIQAFGLEYEEYKRKTKRLIPFIY